MSFSFICKFIRTELTVVFLVLAAFTGFAATKTWTTTAGGSWATAGNWSPNGAPANGDDVIIPALTGGAAITNVPTRTLNSLTYTGSGASRLEASASGNVVSITTSWYIPSGYTLTIGAAGARLVWTLLSTCSATLDGYCAFDAGNTNRNFTVNGILIVNSTGMLYDPNPSGGSDFYLTNTATLKTQKTQGITVTSAANAAALNFNVAVCFGGSYSYATGANYEYNGATGQITGAGLNQNTPNSLTVNLSGGNTLTLTASTTLSGSLTLTSGKVNLNANTLTLGTSAASVGVLTRTADFLFNGTFSRWFTTTSFAIANVAGLFPLGTSSGDYRPLWVAYSANLTTAGVISAVHTATYPATFIAASHNDASWGNVLQGVSNSVWTITTSTLAFNGSTGIVRYGGTGYGTNTLGDLNASLAASVLGTHGAATNVNTTYEVNRTALSTANIANAWRIGTKNTAASPLPITLLNFDAKWMEENVEVNWSTASEKNNDFFTVEKSKDGMNFELVNKVKAAVNSSTKLSYTIIDPHPFEAITYYRLKQTDLDGQYKYFKTVAVENKTKNSSVTVYPNPSNGLVKTRVTGAQLQNTTVEVFNSLGQGIYSSHDLDAVIDLTNYPEGVYFVKVISQNESFIEKIVFTN